MTHYLYIQQFMPSASFTGTAVLSGWCKLLILLTTWKYLEVYFCFKAHNCVCSQWSLSKSLPKWWFLTSIISEVYWPCFKIRKVVSKIIMHKSTTSGSDIITLTKNVKNVWTEVTFEKQNGNFVYRSDFFFFLKNRSDISWLFNGQKWHFPKNHR